MNHSFIKGGYRDPRIDSMRGLAIIIVILEHSIGVASNPVAKIFLSFHMPLFFVISGYLAKNESKRTFWQNFKKKAFSLLVPQITIGLLLWVYNYLVSHLILHNVGGVDLNPITCITHYWFLIVMFYVVILWDIIFVRIKWGARVKEYIGLIICAVYLFLIPSGIEGPLFIAVTPVAIGFFMIGHFLRDHVKSFETEKLHYGLLLLTICLLLSSQINSPVLMYDNDYGMRILFLVSTVSGVAIVWIVSKYTNIAWIEWCGMNSIILYVLHFTIVQGIRGVLVRVFSFGELTRGLAVFAISFPITLLLSRICEKYMPFLFGKKMTKT